MTTRFLNRLRDHVLIGIFTVFLLMETGDLLLLETGDNIIADI
jgi:hypothetical protein